MGRYFLKRLLISILLIIGISVITFFFIRLVPGDTVTAMLGAQYSEEQAEILRQKYGLDKPLIFQYILWIKQIFQGDFGYSIFTGKPVISAILERLPVTLELALISVIFSILIGIPLGVISAMNHNKFFDYFATSMGLVGVSVPGFWLGTIYVLIFSLILGWFPSHGYISFLNSPIYNLIHMILPGLALGGAVSAVIMRITRSSVLEVLNKDYIKLAKAKGVTKYRLIMKYILKNSLIPVITVIGIQVGYLLGGTVVIEEIFSLPGIGRLSLQAINNRDYTLLQGTILFTASAFVIINFIVDILYSYFDPRIKLES